MGHRDGLRFHFPKATHQLPRPADIANEEGQTTNTSALPEAMTAWDALGELSPAESIDKLKAKGKWADLLPSIPEGHNYLYHTNRGKGIQLFGWRSRYWSMLLKLAKNRPSWTITASPGPAIGPFHWENRRLASNELCALQTFPSDYKIVGNSRSVLRQIGNAVPPLMAEILACEIGQQWFGLGGKRSMCFSLTRSLPVPAPEPITPVEDPKYLDMIANHEDHPGKGLGPRAIKRGIKQEQLRF